MVMLFLGLCFEQFLFLYSYFGRRLAGCVGQPPGYFHAGRWLHTCYCFCND